MSHHEPKRRQAGPARARKHVTQTIAVATALVLAIIALRTRPASARAADPTFAEDVAPVFYKNCTTCHHPGGMAPFTLLDYDTAASHADEIRGAVAERVMPPWHADAPHGVFTNDRRLSDDDRNVILRWIDAGAKPGDLTHLPPKPDYSARWAIGTPDTILTIGDDFTVPASGTVDYQYFQVQTNFTEDKWVQAVEIMPGASEVVHHVLVFARVPAAPTATPPANPPATTPALPPVLIRNKAQAQPAAPPRHDSLNAPPKTSGALIATYVPGTSVNRFPAGTALRIRPGTILTFQMHYTAHGHEMKDRTSIGFKFAKGPPQEEIFTSSFFNGQFTLPAGASNVAIPAEIGFGRPVRIWGIMPHTHLRGTRWLYEVERPDSSRSVILSVPRYDFNWQTFYMFATPLELPAGSRILSTAWYDNSAGNKHNPDPTIDVHWGEQTWEEMQYTGFIYSLGSSKRAATGGVKTQ